MSDLPTKHSSYSTFTLSGGENDTIFDYPTDFKGEGPTKENASGEGAANYAFRKEAYDRARRSNPERK